jgi:hypothetical protein
MMRGNRSLLALAALATCLVVPGAVARGEDEKPPERAEGSKKSEGSSEFPTTWFGVRLGFWYQPQLDMNMKIGGTSQGAVLINTLFQNSKIDVEQDLSVRTRQAAPIDYFESFEYGVPEAEVFFDSEWLSVSFWGVSPFRYHGEKQITRSITFAGQTFSLSTNVDTTLDQAIGGVDVKVNIFNNRFFRVSPILAGRVLALDWVLKDSLTGYKATTEDINSPIKYGRWQILPYPEIGAEIRVGFRSILEVDAKITGMHIFYQSYEGTTVNAEAGLTVYPLGFIDIENLGIRVGARYYHVDVASKGTDSSNESNFNMTILGGNLSVIVRF